MGVLRVALLGDPIHPCCNASLCSMKAKDAGLVCVGIPLRSRGRGVVDGRVRRGGGHPVALLYGCPAVLLYCCTVVRSRSAAPLAALPPRSPLASLALPRCLPSSRACRWPCRRALVPALLCLRCVRSPAPLLRCAAALRPGGSGRAAGCGLAASRQASAAEGEDMRINDRTAAGKGRTRRIVR
jgi:hypothetical protein